jgi:hypothetical protein
VWVHRPQMEDALPASRRPCRRLFGGPLVEMLLVPIVQPELHIWD